MTTTEEPQPDGITSPATPDPHADRLARLATLRARRTDLEPASVGDRVAPQPPAAHDVVAAAPTPVVRAPRRSLALNAKIVTVGASTTAMFGLMAAFGIADGRGADTAAAPAAPPPATLPPLATTVEIGSGQSPTTVVAEPIVTSGAAALAPEVTISSAPATVLATVPGSAPATVPTPAAVPVPVAVPVVVDVAVPPPPAPEAAPAPAVDAQSSGS